MNFGKYHTTKKEEYKYSAEFEECIIKTCQYCIENSFNADAEKQLSPIMMLGEIQSGKTRAYTGLIALAFDNDFDMVFILTKSSKALVQQTESRMKREFNQFILQNEIEVKNIIKMSYRLTGYQLEKKLIIIAKKEKNNLDRLVQFINEYSIQKNKRTIIIDDEADSAGIGYDKVKESEEFDLRIIASKVNKIRGNLNGCVFVQVTATPYALFLQPEFNIGDKLKPIKPFDTVLVPKGEKYIGGKYYFIDSTDSSSTARFLFEPVEKDEHEIVSIQKRKGKKSKIDDRRSFKVEEILLQENKLPVFKRGIMNFFIGAIFLRECFDDNKHYAYVIHTATQKNSHISLKTIADTFFSQIHNRNEQTLPIIEKLIHTSYSDIKGSVEAFGFTMPNIEFIKEKFYESIDKEYYRVDVVNSDKNIEELLDEDSGELDLNNPFSIFIGGQVLDRGVTISNLIGFYYGRNPRTMQQDTVMQHSRMFGYRDKELLSVTRFYTTRRIHSNMTRITEIDMELRNDIKNKILGSGIYFIKKQDGTTGSYGQIVPCSPSKILVSDVIFLSPYKRIFPIGFTPNNTSQTNKINDEIYTYLQGLGCSEKSDGEKINIENVEKIIQMAYSVIRQDEDASRYITEEELILTLRFMLNTKKLIPTITRLGRNLSKYKVVGNTILLSDAPDTPTPFNVAKELAIDLPVLILIQELGEAEGWNGRPFWWPILVAPKNVKRTVYASKTPKENVAIKD